MSTDKPNNLEHWRLTESVENTPDKILEQVQKIFDKLQEAKGKQVFMRVPPTIRIEHDIESDKIMAMIHCRFTIIHDSQTEPMVEPKLY